MLKGIDPLLGPELLCILRSMGHGDEIAIVDANFPAAATARRLVRLDGLPATPIVRAIAAILPLDHFELDAAFRMATTGAPGHIPPVVAEFAAILLDAGYVRRIAALERTDFYSRAREAFAVVASGETRLWGNLILRKGAIEPT